MNPSTNRNRVERMFVISMVVLCGTLTVLQYGWTGEVARAEMGSLRASLANQVGLVCKSFDAELRKSSAALIPAASELKRGTMEAVHIARLREWKSGGPRPIFKRMAVAVPSKGDLELFEIDGKSERLVRMAEWPAGWRALRENLSDKLRGGAPPFENADGLLLEFPVMSPDMFGGPGGSRGPGGPGGRGGPRGPDDFEAGFDDGFGRGPGGPGGPGMGEREWVILELDAAYVTGTWLPELVSANLNPEGKPVYDVKVTSKFSPFETVFSTGGAVLENGGGTLKVDFNFLGLDAGNRRGRPASALWTMEAGQRDGALEAIVAGSRKKNLAVAVALNALILAAGWMLLRVTRHSRELAEERMKFVANVTHELRTPLTVIRGAAHNLKRGIVKDQEGVARYSGLILEHAESLGEMVEQVLDFSGGQHAREQIRVDPAKMLREAVLTIKGDARFNTCEIDHRLPADLPDVTVDPASLRRALLNLIENAAKHGGAGGKIKVSAAALAGRVEIQVTDHGPGIPKEEQRDIFKPFFRGGTARSNQVRGSGLGLGLVKEIVEAHGGQVFVSSEIGRGSTFTVNLPATP